MVPPGWRKYGVDAKRIGILWRLIRRFITLMGLFTTPDVFAAGAALRPVTDWAHYNHGYTGHSQHLYAGQHCPMRPKFSIYYANGLKGALLICHGMVDTNVHRQDVVRLSQRLIELGKDNWELAVYPMEDHICWAQQLDRWVQTNSETVWKKIWIEKVKTRYRVFISRMALEKAILFHDRLCDADFNNPFAIHDRPGDFCLNLM